MPDSRAIDQESRRVIREELLTNLLVEAGAGSGKTQMLAERMAAGIAAGVYDVGHMAAVTFTRKAASELRGRFHLALESELARASIGADAERAGRLRSALTNLERFFAGTIHSFCARLLRERPVESGVSPGFTELDEIQDLELRRRVWRDFVTGARAAGDPDMMALLQAELRPKDLDSAFATLCTNDDVDFPSGEANCPDPTAPRKALERFWKELQRHLPSTVDPNTTCVIQQAARKFAGQLRVSLPRLDRPSVMAALLDTWDCESRITQKCWADSPAEKRKVTMDAATTSTKSCPLTSALSLDGLATACPDELERVIAELELPELARSTALSIVNDNDVALEIAWSAPRRAVISALKSFRPDGTATRLESHLLGQTRAWARRYAQRSAREGKPVPRVELSEAPTTRDAHKKTAQNDVAPFNSPDWKNYGDTFAPEMPAILEAAVREGGADCTWEGSSLVFLVECNGPLCRFRLQPLPFDICLLAPIPVRVPGNARLKLCEAITRINWKLMVGNFEMNMDDGLLQFRAELPLHGAVPVPEQVACIIGAAQQAIAEYGLALLEAALTDHAVEWLLTRAEKQAAGGQKSEAG